MATAAAPAPSDSAANTWKPELREIPVDAITVGGNVRADVGDITELAASIEASGLLSPIRVAELGAGQYELVYGQRRVAAAKHIGLKTIPAIVDAAQPGRESRVVEQLIENLQRADLNALDAAKAYRWLLDTGLSQRQLAERLGIAQPTIANTLAVLKQPEPIQRAIAAGELTRSHVEVLARLPEDERQEVARRVVEHKMSTRQLEEEIDLAAKRQTVEDQRRDRLATRDKELLAGWLALLLKKKANPATTTLVGWAGIPADGLAALAKRGWKRSRSAARGANQGWRAWQGPRPKEFCDCDAYELTYRIDWSRGETYHAQVHPACIVKAHQAAADKAEREAFEAQQAEQRAVERKAAEERAAALAPLATALVTPIPPAKARLILFALLAGDQNGYYRAQRWAFDRGIEHFPYDGWREHLWTAIVTLDHGPLLVAIAEITASAAIDAGGPVLEAIDALLPVEDSSQVEIPDHVVAKKARKAKS